MFTIGTSKWKLLMDIHVRKYQSSFSVDATKVNVNVNK